MAHKVCHLALMGYGKNWIDFTCAIIANLYRPLQEQLSEAKSRDANNNNTYFK